MSTKRKLQREIQRNNGELDYAKVIARKLGCSPKELKKRMERREKNLREINGGTENGKE